MSILIIVIYITLFMSSLSTLLYIEEFTFVREENEIYKAQHAHLDLSVFQNFFSFYFVSLLLLFVFFLNRLKCLFNGLAGSLFINIVYGHGDDIRHSYYVLNVEYPTQTSKVLFFFCANKFCMKICK